MARRPRVTDEDRAAWAHYLRDAIPLDGRERIVEPVAIAPSVVMAAALPLPLPLPAPPPGAKTRRRELAIGHAPGGLDKSTWLHFSGGKRVAERRLDLHAHTVEQAFARLHHFLANARADRVRVVEIITGRGSGPEGGVLKRELPLWLNLPEFRPYILAAAHPHAANTGSVRLLLRRVREDQ